METDLFNSPKAAAHRPLAVRMRPQKLSEIVGQPHIIGPDALLPRLIKDGSFGNIILYGPPGCGKTTLAEVVAQETKSHFVRINAVLSNVAELRDILKLARYEEGQTILFIDEIHRFNRAQQDLLLPDVEAGNIQLIGATTHNPGFYVIAPLLSRSHLFRLEPVKQEACVEVLKRALEDAKRGLGNTQCTVAEGVLEGIASLSEGDMRRALNALETLVLGAAMGSELRQEDVEQYAQERGKRYDRNEDEHYDTVSAFIKSIRGGDPDAALYWMAKMIEGGEDPRFIARRLVILASEDVGLADSRGLLLADAAYRACEVIGMPECEINLSHVVIFLATSPKSNSAYMGLKAAQQEIRKGGYQAVPTWLRDSHSKSAKRLGYGKDYEYSHEHEEGISGQEYMLDPKTFYHPKSIGAEVAICERLECWRELKAGKG